MNRFIYIYISKNKKGSKDKTLFFKRINCQLVQNIFNKDRQQDLKENN